MICVLEICCTEIMFFFNLGRSKFLNKYIVIQRQMIAIFLQGFVLGKQTDIGGKMNKWEWWLCCLVALEAGLWRNQLDW